MTAITVLNLMRNIFSGVVGRILQTNSTLQIEIAATVDWGDPFVKACYDLEMDSLLALECYEGVDCVVGSPSHPHHEQRVIYERNCVKDGITYFKHQLKINLKTPLQIFKYFSHKMLVK